MVASEAKQLWANGRRGGLGACSISCSHGVTGEQSCDSSKSDLDSATFYLAFIQGKLLLSLSNYTWAVDRASARLKVEAPPRDRFAYQERSESAASVICEHSFTGFDLSTDLMH